MPKDKNVEKYALFAIVIVFVVASLMVLKDVFFILAYSALLGYFLLPFFRYFLGKNIDRPFSAIITLVLFISFVFLPILLFLYYVSISFLKVVAKYKYFLSNPDVLNEQVQGFLINNLGINSNIDISGAFTSLIKVVVDSSSSFFYSIPVILIYFFIILFITYYFLIHNKNFKEALYAYIPLKKVKINFLLSDIKENLNTLFRGYFLTGLVQTLVAFVGYLILGVPNLVIVTFLTFIFSLIPYIGTPVVWVPISLYLYLVGFKMQGFLLFIYGTIFISSVDNFVRPFLMSNKKNLSPPLVFVGFLGGLSLMGVPGILLGPLILSTTICVLKMLKTEE